MSLSGTQYASIEDLSNFGLPSQALSSVDKSTWNQALIVASSEANSYIGCKYSLPLSRPYDPALVEKVCLIATWKLMARRGFNPGVAAGSSDAIIRQGYIDAREWLVRVANGQASLTVVQAAPESLQPDVVSAAPRGYGDLAGNGTVSNYVPGTNNWGT